MNTHDETDNVSPIRIPLFPKRPESAAEIAQWTDDARFRLLLSIIDSAGVFQVGVLDTLTVLGVHRSKEMNALMGFVEKMQADLGCRVGSAYTPSDDVGRELVDKLCDVKVLIMKELNGLTNRGMRQ